MDLTLVEGSSWLIKPFCFVFFPKAEVGQHRVLAGRQEHRQGGCCGFPWREQCSGSFADSATGLELSHECLVWP